MVINAIATGDGGVFANDVGEMGVDEEGFGVGLPGFGGDVDGYIYRGCGHALSVAVIGGRLWVARNSVWDGTDGESDRRL
jgi:hypothetical protein